MAKAIEIKRHQIFDGQAATGAGTSFDAREYTDFVLEVGTASSANLTVKFQVSYQDTEPSNWAGGPAIDGNQWEYAAVYDLNDPSTVVTGDTGFSVTGTDDFKNYVLNVPHACWVNARVTARSAGNVDVHISASRKV